MMSVNKITVLAIWVITLMLSFATKVNANTEFLSSSAAPLDQTYAAPSLERLLEDDRVRIRSWVQPNSHAVVGQQLELNIEVATSSWFSGGTRISRFEMDDAIVLRRNKFAVNSSRREKGYTWSVQLWTITIYPQRSGSFEIPAIDVHVSVSTPLNPTTAISGILQTQPHQFNALLPEAIQNTSINQWIASSKFSVSDEFDKPLGEEPNADLVGAGDAIRRTITLRAENIAAMMLPAINVSSAEGLATYMRPARLEDRVNRGSYVAIRREVISYVAENEGVYTLPEISLHWWNTQTSSLEQIILPSRQLRVGRAAADSSLFQAQSFPRTLAYWLTIGLVIAVLAYLLQKSTRVQRWWYALSSLFYPESQQQKRKLIRSYPGNDPAIHVFKTLQWLETYGPGPRQSVRTHLNKHPNTDLLPLFDRMMQHAFGSNASALSHQEFRFFIDTIDRSLYGVGADKNSALTLLNPRPS